MADTVIENLVTRLTGQPDSYFRMLDESGRKTTKAATQMERLQFLAETSAASLNVQARAINNVATGYDRMASEASKAGSVLSAVGSQIGRINTYIDQRTIDRFTKTPEWVRATSSAVERGIFGGARAVGTRTPVVSRLYGLYDTIQKGAQVAERGARMGRTSDFFAEQRGAVGGINEQNDRFGTSPRFLAEQDFKDKMLAQNQAWANEGPKKVRESRLGGWFSVDNIRGHSADEIKQHDDQMKHWEQQHRQALTNQNALVNEQRIKSDLQQIDNDRAQSAESIADSLYKQTSSVQSQRRAALGDVTTRDQQADMAFFNNARNKMGDAEAKAALANFQNNRSYGRQTDTLAEQRAERQASGRGDMPGGGSEATLAAMAKYNQQMSMSSREIRESEFAKNIDPNTDPHERQQLINKNSTLEDQKKLVDEWDKYNSIVKETRKSLKEVEAIEKLRREGAKHPEAQHMINQMNEAALKSGIPANVSRIGDIQNILAERDKLAVNAQAQQAQMQFGPDIMARNAAKGIGLTPIMDPREKRILDRMDADNNLRNRREAFANEQGRRRGQFAANHITPEKGGAKSRNRARAAFAAKNKANKKTYQVGKNKDGNWIVETFVGGEAIEWPGGDLEFETEAMAQERADAWNGKPGSGRRVLDLAASGINQGNTPKPQRRGIGPGPQHIPKGIGVWRHSLGEVGASVTKPPKVETKQGQEDKNITMNMLNFLKNISTFTKMSAQAATQANNNQPTVAGFSG